MDAPIENTKSKQSRNCKYVVRLPDGGYVYAIQTDGIYTCKSRLRARQFNRRECIKLKKFLHGAQLVRANWERVDTKTK